MPTAKEFADIVEANLTMAWPPHAMSDDYLQIAQVQALMAIAKAVSEGSEAARAWDDIELDF